MEFSMNIDFKSLSKLGVNFIKKTAAATEAAGQIILEELRKSTIRFRRSENVGWDKHASANLSESFRLIKATPRTYVIISTAPYAKKQDEGGVITMKPGGPRMLIPLPGFTRAKVKELQAQGKTFAKNDTILRRWGKGVRPIAVTRKFITLKPKNYVMKATVRATPRINIKFQEMYGEL